MRIITPAGFETFFERIDALIPEAQKDIPRGFEVAKEFGLEFLPPPSET